MLAVVGLSGKRDNVIGIESLDPALAKVPFPVPTTYSTVLRHYIDISAVVGRQALNALSRYAPTPEAGAELSKLGSDKDAYSAHVAKPCLKLGEVLQLAAGDALSTPLHPPSKSTVTAWPIPFDVIVSTIPRLQARYYSISSSPKVNPTSIHVTCVVLKYQNEPDVPKHAKWVFGVGSNYLLNLKMASLGESAPALPLANGNGNADPAKAAPVNPTYDIEGPRGAYAGENNIYKVPI